MIKRLTALRDWVDARFPLMQLWNDHLARYYAPKNFSYGMTTWPGITPRKISISGISSVHWPCSSW